MAAQHRAKVFWREAVVDQGLDRGVTCANLFVPAYPAVRISAMRLNPIRRSAICALRLAVVLLKNNTDKRVFPRLAEATKLNPEPRNLSRLDAIHT